MIRDRILDLDHRGLPVDEIARQVGRSSSRVRAVLRAAGRTRAVAMPDRIFEILSEVGGYVRVGDIAVRLGDDATRSRVATAVVNLRLRGHRISSRRGSTGGYRLDGCRS